MATEFQNVVLAVQLMMIENNVKALVPMTRPVSPCVKGTNDFGLFPDASTLQYKKEVLGGLWTPSDKAGFVLYGHDMKGDSSQANLVHYTSKRYSRYCYTVAPDGTVTQYNTSGRQIVY